MFTVFKRSFDSGMWERGHRIYTLCWKCPPLVSSDICWERHGPLLLCMKRVAKWELELDLPLVSASSITRRPLIQLEL